jgi:hypothetical protein
MNWIVDERVRLRCPNCNGLTEMVTPACPHCGYKVSEVLSGRYKKYRTRFGMNGGCRKESYDVMLDENEYNYAKSLTDSDMYSYIVNEKWERVVEVYIDPGTDYEGLCGEIEEQDDHEETGTQTTLIS